MKAAIRGLKNYQYDEIEVKVREATKNERTSASRLLMTQIADATHRRSQYGKLMTMLWKRLQDYKQFLHVKKALLLIEYLISHGSEMFVEDCRRRSRDIRKLAGYKYYNEFEQDIAGDVRKKARRLYDILNDTNLMAEARARGGYDAPKKSAPTRQPSQKKKFQDPYDMYSKTSRELTMQEPSRTAAESPNARRDADTTRTTAEKEKKKKKKSKGEKKKRSKRTESGANSADNPFDAAPTDDPFSATDDPFGSGDPFTTPKNQADSFLAAALAPEPSASAPNPDNDVDLLTGQFEFQDPFADTPAEPEFVGRVEWGPDADSDEDKSEHAQEDQKPSTGDAWSIVTDLADLTHLDNDRSKDRAKPSKTHLSMNQMQKKRPSVINLDPIEGFTSPTHQQSSPNPAQGNSNIDAFFTAPPAQPANPFANAFPPMQQPQQPQHPMYGQPMYGQPAYGQQPYGQPAYGQQPGFQQPGFGQPAFNRMQPASQPPPQPARQASNSQPDPFANLF